MDNSNYYDHLKVWCAQIGLTIISEVAQWPWLSVLAVLSGIASLGYTIYKWHWSTKFNNANWEIKQAQLKELNRMNKIRENNDKLTGND